jgi:hypothetical protein
MSPTVSDFDGLRLIPSNLLVTGESPVCLIVVKFPLANCQGERNPVDTTIFSKKTRTSVQVKYFGSWGENLLLSALTISAK